MAEYSLLTPTLVPLGESVPYNVEVCRGCCNIRHRAGSGTIRVKGGTCCNPNRYFVAFHANVTGVADPIRLAIYVDGDQIVQTRMNVVPAAATDAWSVDATTEILVDGCFSNISVRVIEGDTVTVNNANIIVHKGVA